VEDIPARDALSKSRFLPMSPVIRAGMVPASDTSRSRIDATTTRSVRLVHLDKHSVALDGSDGLRDQLVVVDTFVHYQLLFIHNERNAIVNAKARPPLNTRRPRCQARVSVGVG